MNWTPDEAEIRRWQSVCLADKPQWRQRFNNDENQYVLATNNSVRIESNRDPGDETN
jgi:hypothetical protein